MMLRASFSVFIFWEKKNTISDEHKSLSFFKIYLFYTRCALAENRRSRKLTVLVLLFVSDAVQIVCASEPAFQLRGKVLRFGYDRSCSILGRLWEDVRQRCKRGQVLARGHSGWLRIDTKLFPAGLRESMYSTAVLWLNWYFCNFFSGKWRTCPLI